MSRLRPAFSLTADGQRVAVRSGWGLRVTDQVGLESDTLELTLDTAEELEWPRLGATLTASVGYLDDGESLDELGDYVVDGVELTGPPWAVRVSAHAGDLSVKLAEHGTRSWTDATIRDIARDLASDLGIAFTVSDRVSNRVFAHVEQANESALAVLTRIATEQRCVARVLKGRLVVAPRGEAQSASGLPLREVTVLRDQVSRASLTQNARGEVGAIACEVRTGLKTAVEVFGSGEPRKRLRKVFSSSTEARNAADAYRAHMAAGQWRLRLTVLGDPAIGAETRLLTPDLHPGTPEAWTVTSATHSVSSSGYTTDVDAEAA